MAAAIAYRTIFSLSPILLVALAVAGFIFRERALADEIALRVGSFLGEAIEGVVRASVAAAANGATTTGLIGVGLLFWTGSALFLEIQDSLNDIFGTTDQGPTGFANLVRKRLIGFGAILGLGVVLVAVLILNAGIGLLVEWVSRFGGEMTGRLLGPLAPLASLGILALLFAVIFRAFPTSHVPWSAAWRGGLFTSLLFVVGALGLAWYLTSRPEMTAGAFASAAVLILFLVAILAQIFLFGAEITRVLIGPAPPSDTQPAAPVTTIPAPGGANLGLLAAGFLTGLIIGRSRRR